jgi:hypothetical protein
MRHSRTLTEQVRSMMAPANPLPGRAAGTGWASPAGAEIYQQVVAQPADDSPGTAGYAPGPRRASGPGRWERWGRRGAPRSAAGLRRGLAPAAAVIAVLAVIGGLTLAGHTSAGRPATVATGGAGQPRFYVTVNGGLTKYVAQVHDTRTGQTLSSVRLPDNAPFEIAQVAGSPDGRDFFINEGTQLPHSQVGNRVYRLHISANGRSAQLTRLTITPGPGIDGAIVSGLAVSPDGASLAATIQLLGPASSTPSQIEIISLRTGATRTWTTRSFGEAWQPSWSADGKTLSFLWWDHIITTAQGVPTSWDSQVRLLDAAGPGGDLLNSRVIATGGGQLGQFMSAITTPNGKLIIVAAARNVPPGGRGIARLRLVALAPRTGRVLTVYATHQVRYRSPLQQFTADDSCQAFGADATGSQSLVACTRFGRLDNGAFTALPGPSGYGTAAW